MLEKKADDRYPQAQALLSDLKKLQKRLDYEAEYQRDSSNDSTLEDQTQIMQQATTAAPEAEATAAGGAQPTAPNQSRTRIWWLIGLFGLLLLISVFFGYRYYLSAVPINSLAVLPFENRSGNADSEYLSDGLPESLIYRLSQLSNLKVSPTSSVFRYKGRETDPLTIAKDLGVQAVMTGRIVSRGESLVISVELIDARNNKTLWGEQYERRLSDLLAIQREIAGEITGRLQLKLSGEGAQKLAKRYTTSNDAYQLYLQGRYHWGKRTKDEIFKGIEFYKRAIALDSNYALAYSGIADAYNSMGKDPDLSPKEAIPQAKAAAERALEIDPTLAEAHAALADSMAIYDWDWAESQREFNRALELDPNVSYTHVAHATS
jgi:serine/threonine-protein kinase